MEIKKNGPANQQQLTLNGRYNVSISIIGDGLDVKRRIEVN